MDLLKRGWPGGGAPRFDADAALVLCRMRGFISGLLFLYERMRLHREVLRVSADDDEVSCFASDILLLHVSMRMSLPQPSWPESNFCSCIGSACSLGVLEHI